MDDTVAMQDTITRCYDAIGSSDGDGLSAAALKQMSAASQASSPQLPQATGDTSSITSDSSSQEQSSKQQSSKLNQAGGNADADVDMAKQAALSALAGLDMTTTKANLDASKAAAATARANGEIPMHPRKQSNLRSASCRQLGSSSSSSGASSTPALVKSVGFEDPAKSRAADAARPAPGQWRGPATYAATDGQTRRPQRAPASRCISLPAHVLQNRVGMANRLAASYAQDAALQQQLHMMNGSTGLPGYNGFQQRLHQATLGHPADTLTVFQLQHQGLAGPPPSQLVAQRTSYGVGIDESGLSMQPAGMLMQSQQHQQHLQQQQQLQQVRLAQGNWVAAGTAGHTQPQLARWGSGQVPQQTLQQSNTAALAQAQVVNANAQLLAQLQASSQGQQGADTLWMAAPASAALQLSNNPQGMLLQSQTAVSGGMNLTAIPAMQQQQQQQLMAAQLQPAGTASLAAPSGLAGGIAVNGNALLENYQSVSWSVLAAAQGEMALRDQLLTELVLLLTMLHTLSNTLKGGMTPADALSDFSYLAAAARRHMATFTRLSQAGNIAVQLLALVTPLALKHLNSAELLEAAFLVLDTLALANRDVATTVAQQHAAAMSSVGLQLPVEQLLQQQQLGLTWITNLAGAVSRNKAVLESMAGDGSPGASGVGSAPGLVQNTNISGGGLLQSGLGMSVSHPMLMAQQPAVTQGISSSALSPTRKTPLATYFEEGGQGPAATGAGAGNTLGGRLGMPATAGAAAPGMRIGAGTPPGTRLGEGLLATDALGGINLMAAASPGMQDEPALTAAAGGAPGQLGIVELEKLAGLSLGMAPGLQQGGPQPGSMGGGAGTYSPLGGGLSLVGDSGLLLQGGNPAGGNGPSSTGAANIVGV